MSTADAGFRQLCADMAGAWRACPEPEGMHLQELSLSGAAEVTAVAVAFGWTARVMRSGESALLLNDAGYAAEASPLLRSMIEHAIGLWWLVDERGTAVQVLVRARGHSLRKFRDAQSDGWAIEGDDGQQRLQEAIDQETDQATITRDFMQHVRSQAREYDLGALYQAWLIECGFSHATLASAMAYFHHSEDRDSTDLYQEPRDAGTNVSAAVASIVHTALRAYNRLLSDEPLAYQLADWEGRFDALAAQLAAESDSHGAR